MLQATEAKEEVWSGLSGKMVSEIMKVEEQVSAAETSLKREFQAELRKVQEKMAADMAQLKEARGPFCLVQRKNESTTRFI